MTKRKWKKRVTGNFWEPEEGEELVGKLVSIREGAFKREIYDIEKSDGTIVTVPGSTVLEGVITEDDTDKELMIKFTGWKQGKHGKYRNFEVYDAEDSNE